MNYEKKIKRLSRDVKELAWLHDLVNDLQDDVFEIKTGADAAFRLYCIMQDRINEMSGQILDLQNQINEVKNGRY